MNLAIYYKEFRRLSVMNDGILSHKYKKCVMVCVANEHLTYIFTIRHISIYCPWGKFHSRLVHRRGLIL